MLDRNAERRGDVAGFGGQGPRQGSVRGLEQDEAGGEDQQNGLPAPAPDEKQTQRQGQQHSVLCVIAQQLDQRQDRDFTQQKQHPRFPGAGTQRQQRGDEREQDQPGKQDVLRRAEGQYGVGGKDGVEEKRQDGEDAVTACVQISEGQRQDGGHDGHLEPAVQRHAQVGVPAGESETVAVPQKKRV